MKLILEFDGSVRDFEHALASKDGEFDLFDSIYYQMDYEDFGQVGVHETAVGDIKIIVKE